MNEPVIYKITNTLNGKIYIGKANNLNARWKSGHLRTAAKLAAGEQIGYISHLYRAMIEYGVDNFKIEVIEKCSPDELNTREQFWI